MTAPLAAIASLIALTYALRVVCRQDRRRPALDSRRLVVHIWWIAVVATLAATVIEIGDLPHADAAHEAWHFVVTTCAIGTIAGLRVAGGRVW